MFKLAHGTPTDHAVNEGFDLQDYKISQPGQGDGDKIPSGLDAYGPGSYLWVADDSNGGLKGTIDMAHGYAGDSGKIVLATLDVDEDDLMNNREASEVEVEDWVRAIENYMEGQREQAGYRPDSLRELLIEFEEDFTKASNKEYLKSFEKVFPGLDFDEVDVDDYDDPYDWVEGVMEQYETYADPVSHIHEEGGPQKIAEWSINRSDDLWGTVTSVFNTIAVTNIGVGYESNNKSFKESILEELNEDYGLTAAKVEQGAIMVVFDTDELNIYKVLDVNKEPEQSSDLSP